MNNVDTEYFRIVNDILENGRVKKNRTGIDTIGIFGAQAKYNVDLNAFPILTTKKVHWPAIVHELLWFISGSTNIKYLVDNNVNIWNEWAFSRYQKIKPTLGGLMLADELLLTNQEKRVLASKFEPEDIEVVDAVKKSIREKQNKFIQRIRECPPLSQTPGGWEAARFAIEWGELGEGTYGGMWRAFPYHDSTQIDPQVNYVDQLQKVIDKLKTNPDDRRMIVSAWHPYWVDHCALPPCHCLFHFHTEELTSGERCEILHDRGLRTSHKMAWTQQDIDECDKYNIPTRRLNCLLYQRSQDTALGNPFNVASYSLLTAMMSQVVNMVPGTFTHSTGDTHIYLNHIDGLKLQLTREPKKLPSVWLNPEVKSLFDFKYDDIKLLDYEFHPTIKFDVAV